MWFLVQDAMNSDVDKPVKPVNTYIATNLTQSIKITNPEKKYHRKSGDRFWSGVL